MTEVEAKVYNDLKKKYQDLQLEFEQYKQESVKWSIEDFIERAKTAGYTISKKKAQEALEHMIRKHDAELGISWITIDCYLDIYGKTSKKHR